MTRDRSVAVAVGRPMHINLAHSDVEMVCEEDFVDENGYCADPFLVKFYIQYAKLCEIMGVVLSKNYPASPKAIQQRDSSALLHCESLLADWLENCPEELKFKTGDYEFWTAYLNCVYYTVTCLLHRAHLPLPSKTSIFLSKNPAFHAANMITSIMEGLDAHNELRCTPPFMYVVDLSTPLTEVLIRPQDIFSSLCTIDVHLSATCYCA